jgi:hypothetical protein
MHLFHKTLSNIVYVEVRFINYINIFERYSKLNTEMVNKESGKVLIAGFRVEGQ